MPIHDYMKAIAANLQRAAQERRKEIDDRRRLILEKDRMTKIHFDNLNQEVREKESQMSLVNSGQIRTALLREIQLAKNRMTDIQREFQQDRATLEQEIQALENQANEFISQSNNFARIS